jgi:ribosomal protection tetracycline resistance protein
VTTLNLGILAHVDAGKTSLTERLLYAAGIIDEIGSVDLGNTQTDSLELERQRGITIKSAVVSFVLGGSNVNLIDTPGHPDFIAEVERVLSVLDGAVLVVSAVEGVQPQTRVLMRTLTRLRIPTLIFVNKIDRAGARGDQLIRDLREKLAVDVVPIGSVSDLGTPEATFTPFTSTDGVPRLVEVLADHDDALLAAYLDDETAVSPERARAELAIQTRQSLVHPVFFGSAITGAGIEQLSAGTERLLPAGKLDADEPTSGIVFTIERGPAGEKIAYLRMFSGAVHIRDQLHLPRGGGEKVTGIAVFENGAVVRRSKVSAGQIAKVWGLRTVQVGDAIGGPRATASASFAPPSLETVIGAVREADRGSLHAALSQLAEQDPLINFRTSGTEVSVSLYGEVQKEVIQATLAGEYGLAVTFRETTTICVERPNGSGGAVEFIGKEPNPFLATVGLRVDPAPTGAGVQFRLEVELGSMPFAFIRAIEEAVNETLQQGIRGWPVIDCTVTLTHSGYWARQSHSHGTFDKSMSSTAGDFRNLTPLVLMSALAQAGTTIYEPIHAFHLEAPADTLGLLLPALAQLRAIPRTSARRDSGCVLDGDISAAQVHELTQRLPALTHGEGLLESAFDHYQAVVGAVPNRPRSDHDPLNREEYLLSVVRRVTQRPMGPARQSRADLGRPE